MSGLSIREKNSSRLRNSERVAELCDFEYNTRTSKYGGFFSVFQLEKIVRVLEELRVGNINLQVRIDELREVKKQIKGV